MPTFNGMRYVGEAIASALAQSESNIEVIAVDDGSSDGTFDLLQAMAAKDARLKVLSQPHAGRPSIGKNLGLQHAAGEYICFLDQDDVYHPRKIEASIACLDSRQDLHVLFHDVTYIDRDGKELPESHLESQRFSSRAEKFLCRIDADIYRCSKRFHHFMALNYSAMSTTSVMFRRSIPTAQPLRFPADLRVTDDAEFWFKLARGREVLFLDRRLSFYRFHESNMSLNAERMLIDQVKLHERNFADATGEFSRPEVAAYRRKLARIHLDLGYFYFRQGRLAEARSVYRKALRWKLAGTGLQAYAKTFLPPSLIHLCRRFVD